MASKAPKLGGGLKQTLPQHPSLAFWPPKRGEKPLLLFEPLTVWSCYTVNALSPSQPASLVPFPAPRPLPPTFLPHRLADHDWELLPCLPPHLPAPEPGFRLASHPSSSVPVTPPHPALLPHQLRPGEPGPLVFAYLAATGPAGKSFALDEPAIGGSLPYPKSGRGQGRWGSQHCPTLPG